MLGDGRRIFQKGGKLSDEKAGLSVLYERYMKAPQGDVRFRFCISAESVSKDH